MSIPFHLKLVKFSTGSSKNIKLPLHMAKLSKMVSSSCNCAWHVFLRIQRLRLLPCLPDGITRMSGKEKSETDLSVIPWCLVNGDDLLKKM